MSKYATIGLYEEESSARQILVERRDDYVFRAASFVKMPAKILFSFAAEPQIVTNCKVEVITENKKYFRL